MLQAYVDASGKGDPNILVIAGYIATDETWDKFSREWQARLNQAGISHFKMNEMAQRPEIAGWFYRAIEEHAIKAAISCVVHTDELVGVIRAIRWPAYVIEIEQLENPYYFAFKAITDVLAQYQHQLGLTEPVDFIFDNETEKVRIPKAWEMMRASSAPEFAVLMGDTPIYRDDKDTFPLQAADLYAWWILKWEREGRTDWARDLPFPWGAKRDLRRLAMSFSERDFLIEYSRALAKCARNQQEFDYAASILPADLYGDEE